MVHTYDQDMLNDTKTTSTGTHTVQEIYYKKVSAWFTPTTKTCSTTPRRLPLARTLSRRFITRKFLHGSHLRPRHAQRHQDDFHWHAHCPGDLLQESFCMVHTYDQDMLNDTKTTSTGTHTVQ